MRGLAYVIAAVAAVGIMVVIATSPGTQEEEGVAATSVAAPPDAMAEAGTLTLSVPEMHCEFACYPKVKEALEQQNGVQEVNLAEQKEEGVLDNRAVVIKYEPGFSLNAAIASLDQAGYAKSEMVQ